LSNIMASLILGGLGSSLGNSILGSFGASIGYIVGSMAAMNLDMTIFGGRKPKNTTSYHDLHIQTSTYGKIIPTIFGTTKLSGNVIWKGLVRTENKRVRTGNSDKYSQNDKYRFEARSYVSFAIAIAQGEIAKLNGIWADGIYLDRNKTRFRFYPGNNTQLPDSIIESFMGVGNVPAFRELAYIVFEDFPITDFGNRIPNFTFEIEKQDYSSRDNSIRNKLNEIVIIPGTGEFVYDTQIQSKYDGKLVGTKWIEKGKKRPLNNNADPNITDAVLAIDDMKSKLPNLKWVSVVTCWFASDLNIKSCKIKPAVEYNENAITEPDLWSVGSYSRNTAHLISKDENNNPNYGGTPSDKSLLRFIKELKKRGYNVMLYPLIMVDMPGKPWRGSISGEFDDVTRFFNKNGYNEFILHYAALTKDLVDGFIIGSELVSLNKISDGTGNFPAIDELCKLAQITKKILGNKTSVTYAADWSEYHHTDNGWYHLDKLWASEYIDVVGIDAYFPILPKDSINQDEFEFNKAEGVEFYFAENEKQPLSIEYAWKNIDWWWENFHVNPDGSTTSWQPKSKKIWFTEFGFPSIDNAGSQPNIFFDPKSIEGGIPINSLGFTDFSVQQKSIEASLNFWKSKAYIDKMFLWCWDARPFPAWPFLNSVWNDGNLWEKGHWLNGKIGTSDLDKILLDICALAGISPEYIMIGDFSEYIKGLVINKRLQYRDILALIKTAFNIDIFMSNGILNVKKPNKKSLLEISKGELISLGDESYICKTRESANKQPRKIEVYHLSQVDGSLNVEYAERISAENDNVSSYELPLMLYPSEAKYIANNKLWTSWNENIYYEFNLPPKYLSLEPGDVISLDGTSLKINELLINNDFIINVKTTKLNEITKLPFENICLDSQNTKQKIITTAEYKITAFQYLNKIYFAASALSGEFKELGVFLEKEYIGSITKESIMGKIASPLLKVSDAFFDYQKLKISLIEGELENSSDIAVIGQEIIRFGEVTYLNENEYEISEISRGIANSVVPSHEVGEDFVIFDAEGFNFEPQEFGSIHKFKILELGQDFDKAQDITITPEDREVINPDSFVTGSDNIKWCNYSIGNDNNLSFAGTEVKYIIDLVKDNQILSTNIEVTEHVTSNAPIISGAKIRFKSIYVNNKWKLYQYES
jgi:hypothetical protein